MRFRFMALFALFGLVAAIGLVALPQRLSAADPLDLSPVQKMMGDQATFATALRTGNTDEIAWQMFLQLNSPLTGNAAKLWESWRQTSSVYLPDGGQPAPWGQEPPPPQLVIDQAKKQGLDLSLPFHNLDSDVQSDGLALRDRFEQNSDQNVRYQILMNQDTFQYIVTTKIYNMNGQQALAQSNTPANFPWSAFEIKTSWIWIGTNQDILNQLQGKYYIVNAYYEQFDSRGKSTGVYQVGRAALSGMHIITKPVPQWFWVTFENVYDAQYTFAHNELPMSDSTKQANAIYQPALKSQGSIFANYQLTGTQWQFLDPSSGQPILLANSQIETAFQRSSSCATCHSTSSYSVKDGYFNMVKEQDGGITYYTGNPPTDKMTGYDSLDFVWSLKRAQWQRSP
jgi:hypothetical protein